MADFIDCMESVVCADALEAIEVDERGDDSADARHAVEIDDDDEGEQNEVLEDVRGRYGR